MMKCRQCQEAIKVTGCTKSGVCGKSPEVAGAQDMLVQSLMVLSMGTFDKELPAAVVEDIDRRVVDGLFMTLTNTNFDLDVIKDAFRRNKDL
ncbi:MAG: hydroxylamine reductase, partial [Euryarchaeota archaeon]|nr:hydroxylamine reductase [Euryarchaeota archaeon]